jgi:pimeloyl-ACP methyl ester carboxylesterase
MFPDFLPPATANLTEITSINCAQSIKCYDLNTSLIPQGITTSYVQQGTGNTPILLLHGFDSSLLEFRRLLPLLAENNETWAIDLLGFGFTERKPGLSFSPEQIKTHLYCFWQTLIKQPVILVGASMGGATALDFTLTYPHAVAQLILLDSAGLNNPPIAGKLMFPPLDTLATKFLSSPKVRQKISESAYYDKSYANADAQLCASLHLYCDRWDQALVAFTKSGGYGSFAKQLSEIQQPTLIIWGSDDKILGTKPAKKFAQAIANSQLVCIARVGHVPHLEQPKLTAEQILHYCQQKQPIMI